MNNWISLKIIARVVYQSGTVLIHLLRSAANKESYKEFLEYYRVLQLFAKTFPNGNSPKLAYGFLNVAGSVI